MLTLPTCGKLPPKRRQPSLTPDDVQPVLRNHHYLRKQPAVVFIFSLVLCLGCTPQKKELTWVSEETHRWASVEINSSGQAGFKNRLPTETSVQFKNTLSEAGFLSNRHFVNGSGVALGDVDGDGWVDLYFANLEGPNALYKNLGGWEFKEITEEAGVAAPDQYSTGAVFEDIDGDKDLDLLVTAMGGPNTIFLNDGQGRFAAPAALESPIAEPGSTTMTFADIEGDGDLDLYVGNYKKISVKDVYPPHIRAFDATVIQDQDGYKLRPDFEPHFRLHIEGNRLVRFEYAEPDYFYLNDGAGQFSLQSFTDGRFLDEEGVALDKAFEEWALVARFQDVNGDGAPDLYLCNDFESPDRLWINKGDGTFQLTPLLAMRKTSGSSMSVDFSDIDRDGDVDFFVADMLYPDYGERQVQLGMQTLINREIGELDNRPQIMQNMLMLNRGDGSFADIANMSGLNASGWTWSSLFMDVDLDGFEDLLVSTGHHYDAMDADVQMSVRNRPVSRDWRQVLLLFPPLNQANAAFRNRGDLTFEHMPAGWGLGETPDVAHGMAVADLDNDGDLDVVTNRLNDKAGLYENTSTASRVAVRLRGAGANTQGIGAKIKLIGGAVPIQEKEVSSGGMYLSGSDPLYNFATGDAAEGLALEVVWRSGNTSRIENVQPNRIYEVIEQ